MENNYTVKGFTMLQVPVYAYDPANTEMGSGSEVLIQVRRNKQSPGFTQDVYETSVPEDRDEGQTVITMRAQDGDSQVCEKIRVSYQTQV